MRTPPCFDTAEQYEAWHALTSAAPVRQRAMDVTPNYCQDCSQAYKERMQGAARCRYPRTRFMLVVEPPAGSLPTGREVVGYEPGNEPTAGADPEKKPAVKPGSDPSGQSTPAAQPGSPQPKRTSGQWSGCRLPADVLPGKSE